MVHLYRLVLLVLPLMTGFAQSDPSPGKSPNKSPQYPHANQFEHLSLKDGLSNNSVTAILQDHKGFMWFGTKEGLNKYDGHTFTIFRPNPGQPTRSFQNSYIRGLCVGLSDQLWAVTAGGGLHEINTRTGLVTPHPILATGANRWNQQSSVYKDSQNLLWVSSSAGLARYESARHHFTLYPAPDPEAPVITVLEDHQHRFWVATVRGLYLLNRVTGQFTAVPVPGLTGSQPYFVSLYQDNQDRLWLGTATAGYSLLRLDLRHQPWRLEPYNPGGKLSPFMWRNTIHQDSAGLVWVGTTNGLHAIDPVSDKVVTYRTDPNTEKGIKSNNASAVYHDRSGTLWVGTDNCIDRQAVRTKPFKTYQITPHERMPYRPENRVNALFRDSRGQLWFSNSTTVYRLSANRAQLDSIPPYKLGSIGQHKNPVNSFLADGPDGIWFGTSDGLYHLDQRTGHYTGYPSAILAQYVHRGPRGDLWVGGEGGVASFNPATHQYTYYTHKPGKAGGLPDKYVYGLLVSRAGDVWILINQLGICRLNPKTGRMIRYTVGAKGHLNTNDVLSIHEDKDGIIWIGTHGGGVNRFDPTTGLFSAITHQDGIPGNSVVGITSDGAGQLWVSTDEGLCRVDPKARAVHRYEVSDGLPSNDFLHHAVFRQPHELFFGTENGIVLFDPARIRDNTHPFPVYITELTIMDKPRALTDSGIQLKHDENRLSFGFAALSYEQPGQNQYAYQLVGVNPNWVPNGNRHEVNFTSLPPGTYTLRVKAANSDGYWSTTGASVQVIIHPPWWATWWAYGLYALLAGGAIWGSIRFYTNRLRQRQESEFNRRQAEQLQAVDELKTRFFANITHEFRTPLSLIMAPVEKLLQQRQFAGPLLTTVHRNAGQLLRLINQLLDLSKLEGHHMRVSRQQGEVADFIHQIVAVFERAAEQQAVTLTGMLDQLPTQESIFDADKWEKILINLLSNALKFTPAGGHITLTGLPIWVGEELAGVQFELADSGIGLAPNELPHIFDRFYQADTSNTRAYEGTGIGLALVKELIDLLGGTITVESQPNVGTTFRLTLPVGPVSSGVDALPVSRTAPQLEAHV
ncbi:MAG TPA: two-component regulator propeller domain-containing protein, partial [Spirosoma sp.]|nr:two-component regulator propeller domain-containing protein [Spirosoma sp.]